MATGERPRFLGRPVPPSFDVRRLVIPPGGAHRLEPDGWPDAILVVEAGCLEVVCEGGERRTYPTGSLLGLSWLRTARLVNAGPDAVHLMWIARPGRPASPRDGRSQPPHRCG